MTTEIIGKKLADIKNLDLGTLYPIVNVEQIVIGTHNAEFGTPEGYKLSKPLQAYVPIIKIGSIKLDNGERGIICLSLAEEKLFCVMPNGLEETLLINKAANSEDEARDAIARVYADQVWEYQEL